MSQENETRVTGRIRRVSVSAVGAVLSSNPQQGMWVAAGTVIATAPTISELREPITGGANIEFNAHGHNARTVIQDNNNDPILTSLTRTGTDVVKIPAQVQGEGIPMQRALSDTKRPSLSTVAALEEKHNWKETIQHGISAFWKFFKTPTGFLMTIYFLNIVAWGAMLFFLELKAAPAMNHPSADSDSSPRKIWLEIDSQILNALFCVTGFGLAPWRFRDLRYMAMVRFGRSQHAMQKLAKQNKSWFRPPYWAQDNMASGNAEQGMAEKLTFTGNVAPPTALWKLGFVIWMMVWNTLFQVALCFFMWHYNRINRPSWATGTFIGLGCGVSLLAGLMMWWEGRKVKKIEGPHVVVVENKG